MTNRLSRHAPKNAETLRSLCDFPMNGLSRPRPKAARLRLLRSEMRRTFTSIGRDHRWDLTLSDRVPLELTVDSGVGRNHLDLSGLDLSALRVDSGVGETIVTLPARGGYRASFDSGVGATRILIPDGVAVSIVVDTGIGAVNVDGAFERSGDRYRTPGFEQARDQVELTVDGGVGAITIEQIR